MPVVPRRGWSLSLLLSGVLLVGLGVASAHAQETAMKDGGTEPGKVYLGMDFTNPHQLLATQGSSGDREARRRCCGSDIRQEHESHEQAAQGQGSASARRWNEENTGRPPDGQTVGAGRMANARISWRAARASCGGELFLG